MNQWINESICSKFIGASSDRLPSVGWLMSSFQHSCTTSTFAIKLNRIPISLSELVNPGALHSQASDLRLLASNSQRHNKVWRSQSLPAAQCWAFPLPCAKHCRGCSAGTLATRNWSVIRVIGLIRFACASMTRGEIEKCMHRFCQLDKRPDFRCFLQTRPQDCQVVSLPWYWYIGFPSYIQLTISRCNITY